MMWTLASLLSPKTSTNSSLTFPSNLLTLSNSPHDITLLCSAASHLPQDFNPHQQISSSSSSSSSSWNHRNIRNVSVFMCARVCAFSGGDRILIVCVFQHIIIITVHQTTHLHQPPTQSQPLTERVPSSEREGWTDGPQTAGTFIHPSITCIHPSIWSRGGRWRGKRRNDVCIVSKHTWEGEHEARCHFSWSFLFNNINSVHIQNWKMMQFQTRFFFF